MPNKTKNILLGTLVLALIGGGIGWLSRPAPGKAMAGAPIPVRVAHVQQQDVPRYINGKVNAGITGFSGVSRFSVLTSSGAVVGVGEVMKAPKYGK